jgi:hypothetical protein
VNAVEIEEAISALAVQPFDSVEFPYAFLQAFGYKDTTLKRPRSGTSNKSDLDGVPQTKNIHLAVCLPGEPTQQNAGITAPIGCEPASYESQMRRQACGGCRWKTGRSESSSG